MCNGCWFSVRMHVGFSTDELEFEPLCGDTPEERNKNPKLTSSTVHDWALGISPVTSYSGVQVSH